MKLAKRYQKIILCDFDGTIVTIDTGEFVLNHFGRGNWKTYDDLLERGEISLEKCMREQFSMIRASEEMILKKINKKISCRPFFDELLKYCNKTNTEMVIVSAGIIFIITFFMKRNNWSNISIIAAKSKITNNGFEFTFPVKKYEHAKDFKQDLVLQYRAYGRKVIYIGDGLSDYYAAKEADFVFAVQGKKLANLCKNEGIKYFEFKDFRKVIDYLSKGVI